MTREAFIEELDRKNYSYEIEGNKIVVIDKGSATLRDLTSLPPDVEFRNGGGVWLDSLTSLPPGTVFKNGGGVDLISLNSISRGVEFSNGINVHLNFLTGGRFLDWKGNIKGIDPKRLLNKMISLGLFER